MTCIIRNISLRLARTLINAEGFTNRVTPDSDPEIDKVAAFAAMCHATANTNVPCLQTWTRTNSFVWFTIWTFLHFVRDRPFGGSVFRVGVYLIDHENLKRECCLRGRDDSASRVEQLFGYSFRQLWRLTRLWMEWLIGCNRLTPNEGKKRSYILPLFCYRISPSWTL